MLGALDATTGIEYVNGTANEATETGGAGLAVGSHFGVTVHFGFFGGNTGPYGSLSLEDGISNAVVLCLGFFNNSCAGFGGHIFSRSDMTLTKCLFQANTGGSIFIGIDIHVAFVDCVFDVDAISVSGYVVLSVANCIVAAITGGLPGCNGDSLPPTPSRAETPTSVSPPATLPRTATSLPAATPLLAGTSLLTGTSLATQANTPTQNRTRSRSQPRTVVVATATPSDRFTPVWDLLLKPRQIRRIFWFVYFFDDPSV